MIDRTSPIKTQPKTIPTELTRALTRRPKFLPVENAPHALSRAAEILMRLTSHRDPHAPPVAPCATHAQRL